MELKNIAIIISIIIIGIIFYKFVPLTIKKFLFTITIIILIFYFTYQYFKEKTGG